MGGGRKGNNNAKRKGNNKKKNQKKQTTPQQQQQSGWNFVNDAGPGCYIVRRDATATSNDESSSSSWMLDWEDIDPQDFNEGEVPDVAIDTDDCTLSLCNIAAVFKVAYITVYQRKLMGRRGQVLQQGSTTDNQGQTLPCITFIVLCPPHTFAHLCYFDVQVPSSHQQQQEQDNSSDLLPRIESNVQEWDQHPKPNDEHPQRLGFPLQCTADSDGTSNNPLSSSFLCTQGEWGELTHFFLGNLHAIDFRCPIGTPLLAVGNGVVVDVKDSNTLTGIAVSNLFEWNSIMLQLDVDTTTEIGEASNDNDSNNDTNRIGNNGPTSRTTTNIDAEDVTGGPLFVEYVHIQSASVQVGDRVTRGQVIGTSGSVGFSPEPHLHFSAFRSAAPDAPTVRVRFASSFSGGSTDDTSPPQPLPAFLPAAGNWYDDSGCVEAKSSMPK